MRIEKLAGSRKAMAFGFVLALAVASLLLTTKPAHAASFTVNDTGDGGDFISGGACDANPFVSGNQCTLRAAIEVANATSGADTINFDIGNDGGVKTISPNSQLPSITEPVTIDGYTQNGASKNTQEVGTNAVLKIELSGADAGDFKSGLLIDAPNTVVKGLVINSWDNRNIEISESGAVIEGNFLGTDPTGTLDRGSRLDGVQVVAPNITIGGTTPGARNLISGNNVNGVILERSDNKVEGNLIGTTKDGSSALSNGGSGVTVNGSNNTVGDTTPGARNTIAFNEGHGVVIGFNAIGNRILSNSIFSNGGLGINLSGGTNEDFTTRVNANDLKDPDTGANNLQNYPVLSSATISGGQMTIEGTLNSRLRKTFTIQFFSSPEEDPSGFGEGKTFLGQKTVKTNRKGNRSFSVTFTPAQPVTAGEFVTATATRNSTGDTSEFSGAVTVS